MDIVAVYGLLAALAAGAWVLFATIRWVRRRADVPRYISESAPLAPYVCGAFVGDPLDGAAGVAGIACARCQSSLEAHARTAESTPAPVPEGYDPDTLHYDAHVRALYRSQSPGAELHCECVLVRVRGRVTAQHMWRAWWRAETWGEADDDERAEYVTRAGALRLLRAKAPLSRTEYLDLAADAHTRT